MSAHNFSFQHSKNPFRDQFDPFFAQEGVGDQNTIGIFFWKIGFETKKYHFCVLLDWIVTEAILHPNFEKVIKTTQNGPKTVDNH